MRRGVYTIGQVTRVDFPKAAYAFCGDLYRTCSEADSKVKLPR